MNKPKQVNDIRKIGIGGQGLPSRIYVCIKPNVPYHSCFLFTFLAELPMETGFTAYVIQVQNLNLVSWLYGHQAMVIIAKYSSSRRQVAALISNNGASITNANINEIHTIVLIIIAILCDTVTKK